MKQTAVEWLIEHLMLNEQAPNFNQLMINKAKKMEKEQIMEAWFDGTTNWDSESSSEQYYNETFKSE